MHVVGRVREKKKFTEKKKEKLTPPNPYAKGAAVA